MQFQFQLYFRVQGSSKTGGKRRLFILFIIIIHYPKQPMKGFYFVYTFYNALYYTTIKTQNQKVIEKISFHQYFSVRKFRFDRKNISNLFVLNSESKDQPEKGPDKEIKIQQQNISKTTSKPEIRYIFSLSPEFVLATLKEFCISTLYPSLVMIITTVNKNKQEDIYNTNTELN